MDQIPFNRPYLVGTETGYIEQAVAEGWLSAGGSFSDRCESWLAEATGSDRALLTHSCTAALEAAALLGGFGPGDEVIMPSFTFVSTASAFALRGATPVFVDIEPETLNVDPRLVEAAITPATRAIAVVHYAGVGCRIEELAALADEHGLTLIEDAAQGLMASRNGRALGTAGKLGALSFHETKNVTCGEGGALLINDPELIERAEILWDKGTNRRQFERGEVDRYTWVELGSSLGAGAVTAAFLWAQLECAEEITSQRLEVWDRYHEAFEDLERSGRLRRPVIPAGCEHNGHMYYLLLPDNAGRTEFIAEMRRDGILAVFHYVPLHSSPAGLALGRADGELAITDELSGRLVRLPLWAGMPDGDVDRVIETARRAVSAAVPG
ncbi:MAG: dTDP-4-amino-4,6-dideoxygalactose transaminase [Solirubrobacterales bacterium]|jgi:dTDP-4-amino-4,6-dideoxygalactose transaminase|nr:dTDP-4-amino-4,6-dideoxygalactose transaminase [Solirubrobacterales bacterium]